MLDTDALLERMFLNEEFDVWAVGDGLVAKFPRTDIDAAKVPVEERLHQMLRRVLGDVVPAIRMTGTMRSTDRRFIVHERAAGTQGQTADGVTIAPAGGLADHVGALLGTLHQIGANEAYALGAGTRTVSFGMQPLSDAAV